MSVDTPEGASTRKDVDIAARRHNVGDACALPRGVVVVPLWMLNVCLRDRFPRVQPREVHDEAADEAEEREAHAERAADGDGEAAALRSGSSV